MVLENVLLNGDLPVSIELDERGTISSISGDGLPDHRGLSIAFDEAIAFPGLINSHDHLDFNSFPLLGDAVYDHYTEWGPTIHRDNADLIKKVLTIPKELRVQWSLYKNLLNGVTTVVQHGEGFDVSNELIDVFQDCISIHSVRLDERWKLRLNKPRLNNRPVVIHIGEGTNDAASAEIDELIRWNKLNRRLIGIHGIAMNAEQARSFTALIWCPDSNYFMFRQTADIGALKKVVPIIFGTDSTLTANWDIWKQLRLALDTGSVTTQELYEMVTTVPAKIWGFRDKGGIRKRAVGDIVVARKKKDNFLESFQAVTPADILLVLHKGEVRLFDESLLPQLLGEGFSINGFSKIGVGSQMKYVYGDLSKLISDIREYYSDLDLHNIELV